MSIETSTDRSDNEQPENNRSDASERPKTGAEPSEQLPDVVDISGLDTEQAARLHEQGISTIEALETADSETIAEFANVSVEQAADWLEQARDLASGTEEGPEADVDTDGEEATDEIPSEPPSTFRATIRASPLKTILKALRANVDEARFKIDESGIRVRAVDPANVAMDDLTLNTSAFESYDATPGVLGLDLDRFADPVNLAKKDDLVQFSLDRETRKLVVFVDGIEFRMACLDPATIRAEPTLPELELPASATLDRDVLQQGVKAADLVADHVGFRMDADEEVLRIEAEGDTDTVDFQLDEEKLDQATFAEASSLFSLDYMKKIVRTIPKGASVTVDFGSEFPIMLSYDLDDDAGSMTRMLAPRIET
ncbi:MULTISPECIES: DNA polymerase sliding clamp [unclassified Haloarcula]|uniref:DNA polymerase sliding clamp n=1 Tax=unclassified Haloarcula TaxID=2624677 RepID=UPI0006791AC6|nr:MULTISPECIES: DNA polymerase sliding clamp [unclassified Haloarcula]